jgi:NAD(P)-dependent dehydrogenase (short-subunit alcohol dehydrogenase family)
MDQKIWFITGISSGLGKALAEAALQKGDFVIGTFRQEKQVLAFNQVHKNNGMAYQLDVTNETQAAEVARRVTADFGRLDVLVNNAGVGFGGAIEEAGMDEVRAVFETNFFGALKITQAFLPLFRQQRQGHIVQISSHGGLKAFAGFGIYNASKFALEGISEALAQELAPLGVKLTIVEPGPFRTKFAHDGFVLAKKIIPDYAETAGFFRTRIKAVDGKQEGDPVKAAEAIFALAGMENPPLRLPLGKTALVTIGMKLESVRADLEQSRAIAEGAVY